MREYIDLDENGDLVFTMSDDPRWYDFIYEGKPYFVKWGQWADFVKAYIEGKTTITHKELTDALWQKYCGNNVKPT
jgi:hypothetical protein